MAEFSALAYRLQLDDFRKLDLHFNTESDPVRLLVPPDPNLKALLAPYTLPWVQNRDETTGTANAHFSPGITTLETERTLVTDGQRIVETNAWDTTPTSTK